MAVEATRTGGIARFRPQYMGTYVRDTPRLHQAEGTPDADREGPDYRRDRGAAWDLEADDRLLGARPAAATCAPRQPRSATRQPGNAAQVQGAPRQGLRAGLRRVRRAHRGTDIP